MGNTGSRNEPSTKPDRADIYTLTDLEQVKVIADPLRVRILEALCQDVLTTKQVAERLDEKPTRLYHHVEALERVGLIRLEKTRQNRGTIEKYYTAVARRFRTDPDVFRVAAERGETIPLAEVVTTMMTNTTEELERLVRAGHDISDTRESVLSYVELQATEEDIAAVRDKLMALLKDLESLCCADPPPDEARRYRLTLAYFPLDHD